MSKKILVFLGPPGVGKGTQAAKLATDLNLPHISTGDIFRDHLKRETELGAKAKAYMNEGKLVPDDLTVALVNTRITQEDCADGYILDGFPRTVAQDDALESVLSERAEKVAAALYFDAPRETVVARISGRAELENRPDDSPEKVRVRLEVYDKETGPLVPHYREKGVLHEFDATGTVEDIYAELKSVVSRL
ncbi:adenylate kinase [Planctomycetota bacterium]|nr:adenylate kinase [Planctomycetota bacterium]